MVTEEKHNKKLLVEGPTDLHVVLALCQYYNIPENFDIIDCGGIDDLLRNLELRLTHPTLNQSIGVVVDADNDIPKRYNQIAGIVNKFNKIIVGDSVPQKGLICPTKNIGEHPTFGIWLMPDNVNLGMVEDFALSLIPPEDNMLPEVENTLERIEELGINRYTEDHRSKAKIHTYLSWQEDPGCPIGLSITKNVLKPEGEIAKRFVQWLTQLFSL